jgi:hypothetical protein
VQRRAARDRLQQSGERAQSLADEAGVRCEQPFILEARAELARLRGDDAEAEHHLREAHRQYTEMGATGHAERLKSELAQLGA